MYDSVIARCPICGNENHIDSNALVSDFINTYEYNIPEEILDDIENKKIKCSMCHERLIVEVIRTNAVVVLKNE